MRQLYVVGSDLVELESNTFCYLGIHGGG